MFKIPKHHVAQISIFSTVFSLPPSKGGIEGDTEENPLILHQISKADFKAFLRVLVPLYVNSTLLFIHKYNSSPRLGFSFRQTPPNYSKISVATWKSTLKLSTMWEVTAVRDLAIKNLNKLEVVDMILLGIEYRVSQWFIAGCSRLILRSCGPTEKECNLLGIGFVVQIYGLRERTLSIRVPSNLLKGSGAYQSHCENIVVQLVREAFPDNLKMFDKKLTRT
jgi:hypothetical protein